VGCNNDMDDIIMNVAIGCKDDKARTNNFHFYAVVDAISPRELDTVCTCGSTPVGTGGGERWGVVP
jgi:hypothetical protein